LWWDNQLEKGEARRKIEEEHNRFQSEEDHKSLEERRKKLEYRAMLQAQMMDKQSKKDVRYYQMARERENIDSQIQQLIQEDMKFAYQAARGREGEEGDCPQHYAFSACRKGRAP